MDLNIRCEKSGFKNSIDVAILSENILHCYAAAPITMKELEEGSRIMPCFSLELDEAQQLIDELWRCGIRPSEGTGSAGSLAATERHLKDMQTIAFSALKITTK